MALVRTLVSLVLFFSIVGARRTILQNCPEELTIVDLPNPLPVSIQTALDKIGQLFTLYGTDSVSAAITYNSNVIWEKNIGTMNRTSNTSTTQATMYRIASITKLFSAVLLFRARDKGLIRGLDEDVGNYVSEYNPVNPWKGSTTSKTGITFLNLATHMSGLPNDTPCDSCNTTTPEILPHLNAYPSMLILPPNARPNYSNLGYSILGNFVAEYVFKYKNFEEAVQKEILDIIGLKNTAVTVTPAVAEKMAAGYNGSDPTPAPKEWNLFWNAPSGQMVSSSGDLVRFIDSIFSGKLLSESSTEEFLNTIGFWNSDGVSGQGVTWELSFIQGYLVRYKLGTMPGYNNMVITIPELSLGIVALFSHSPVPVFSVATNSVQILLPALEEYLLSVKPPLDIPANPELYIGTYIGVIPMFGNATVIITLGNSTGYPQLYFVLYLDGDYPGLLSPAKFAPSDKTLLQIYIPAEWSTCADRVYSGLNYQYLMFTFNGTAGISFTLPGYSYGITYNKIL